MHILAFRPAPIQVSYLGFPGTSGAKFIDYIITDRIVTPQRQLTFYSEKVVHLPYCYQVNDHTQTISQMGYTKRDFGLPDDVFVFCSFNQGYKIDETMFNIWMKILKNVPDSVLWLLVKGEMVKKNLRQEAERRSVNPDHLHFADRLRKPDHLERLSKADLALDTRIYNGHTTSSDALWAGVPVITLQGDHFASRVSSSILKAIGMPELVTTSLEEYKNLAVRLAKNQDQLEAVKKRIIENRLKNPLFDTPRFVKNLERVYKEMWEIYLAGEETRHIEIVEN
jgi:predicted O-linked N-acetylglucosamine transferase (SPINDLY family)